jgi:opacity protein-like surface antigen
MVRHGWRGALAALVLVLTSAQAHADVTAFLGVNGSPESRAVTGFSGGMTFVAFGFEGEYASTRESLDDVAPQLRTYMANGFVQNPIPISGLTFYGIAGAGLYRETLDGESQTSLATNVGGGVKIALAGPLQLRLDYRVFILQGEALAKKPQRLYAGVNLKF